jgi:hypothetical protein
MQGPIHLSNWKQCKLKYTARDTNYKLQRPRDNHHNIFET